MVNKMQKVNGTIRYQVYKVGSMNPRKITKLKLSDALKLAKKLNEKTGTKGQPYVINKAQIIYEGKNS